MMSGMASPSAPLLMATRQVSPGSGKGRSLWVLVLTRLFLGNCNLEGCAGREFRHGCRSNRKFLACSGILALTGSALSSFERTKTGQRDIITVTYGLNDGIQRS